MRFRLLLSCLMALLGAAGHAQALTPGEPEVPPREPYRLIFSSSTRCQDPGEFTRQLARRTSRLETAVGAEPAITVLVDLSPGAAQIRGQLMIRAADGSLSVREIPGTDCHEVLAAMALIVALEVDNRPVMRVGSAEVGRADSQNLFFALGARFTGTSGAVPDLSPGFAVYAEVAFATDRLFSPSFRVSGHRTVGTKRAASLASAPGSTATADFELLAGRLAGCPLSFAPVRALSVRPCAFVEVGKLNARGYNVVQEEPSRSLLWTAGGVELAIEFVPAGPFTLGAEAGALFPFLRDAFFFDPEGADVRIHQIKSVGFTAGIGAGFRFF